MAQDKIIYFINSTVATPNEIKSSLDMKGKVCFRNATFIDPEGAIEKCDFVYGAIPSFYSEIPVYGVTYETKDEQSGNAKADGQQEILRPSPKGKASPEKEKVKAVWKPN